MNTQTATALRIFAARTIEGDATAAEHMALTFAALTGVDFTDLGVARIVPAVELAAQIRCATRILANRTAEGDAPAAEYAARTLALLTAKRVQRREAGISMATA